LGKCDTRQADNKKKKVNLELLPHKLKSFRIRIRKHSNIEILYYGIIENMEMMEICGKLGKIRERL